MKRILSSAMIILAISVVIFGTSFSALMATPSATLIENNERQPRITIKQLGDPSHKEGFVNNRFR